MSLNRPLMKTRSIPVVAGIALILVSSARGEFVPGHVFAAQAARKLCLEQEEFGGDRIWEIDPATGEATLFAAIPEELCGFLTGLAFTPDGSRLRASSLLRYEILEFDSEGNMTVALDITDGIACPWGLNNLAYDAEGNFYVLNKCTQNILRFPPDGGPPTVFADAKDGIATRGAIAFAADGDLYFTTGLDGFNLLRRITPEGNAFPFDGFGSIITPVTVTADESGHVYVGLETAEIFKYDAGDPESKDLLAVVPPGGRYSMTMSPDQSEIYVNSWGVVTSGGLWSIDVRDGAVTLLAGFSEVSGVPAGIAVVPVPPPPPIPTVSGWFLPVMALLVLTAGTITIQRRRRVIG